MAKVKVTNLLGEHGMLGNIFTSVFDLALTSDGGKKAVYTSIENGSKLILVGKDFEYDGNAITDGTITSVIFANEDGKRYASVAGGHWDPQAFVNAYSAGGFDNMASYILAGKDTMTGSDNGDLLPGEAGKDRIIGGGGNDWIIGEGGNDTLTGGKGPDEFYFYPGDGHDVITDFDAKGGGLKQDYLGIRPEHTFEETNTRKGMLIEFTSGDSVLLLGVHKLDDTDFINFE